MSNTLAYILLLSYGILKIIDLNVVWDGKLEIIIFMIVKVNSPLFHLGTARENSSWFGETVSICMLNNIYG